MSAHELGIEFDDRGMRACDAPEDMPSTLSRWTRLIGVRRDVVGERLPWAL